MSSLFERATSREALARAWEDISDRPDSEVSDSIGRFAKKADSRLDSLAKKLAEGTYRPAGLFEVVIPRVC